MTILTVIQGAAALCNVAVPTAVVSNVDPDISQMLALAQLEGDESASEIDWRNLKIGMQLTGDGSSTVFALPPDFDRIMPGFALFSSAYPMIPLTGPVTDAALNAMKVFPVKPVRPVWRFIGNGLEVWPALAVNEIVSGEYRSNYWILSVDGSTRKSTFAADGDSCLVPEAVIKLGVVWRWKQAKGLDYAEDFRSWNNARARIAGHDSGNATVEMAGDLSFPATYWPLVIPTS